MKSPFFPLSSSLLPSTQFPYSNYSTSPIFILPRPPHQPNKAYSKKPHCPSFPIFPLRSSPSRHAPPLSVSNQEQQPISLSSAIPIEEIVEKDWSFVDSDSSNSPSQLAHKYSSVISSAQLTHNSRLLVSHGTQHFIEHLVGSVAPDSPSPPSKPFELLLVVHESLFVLAEIKEMYDDGVKCWQGGIAEVPMKWAPFDAIFLCYWPGLGLPLDQTFAAIAARCSPDARLVISYAQGREIVARHMQQYPDMVTSNLPDRFTLEKVAADHSFQIMEFVDKPSFYLAVLKFSAAPNPTE